jgi:hypothetical protein
MIVIDTAALAYLIGALDATGFFRASLFSYLGIGLTQRFFARSYNLEIR